MKKRLITFIAILYLLPAFAQGDTLLSLRIIDTKICMNKKTSAINFSYYFENHSLNHLVVADYYDPCIWETLKNSEDTNRTLGLVLIIKDDSGKIVLPHIVTDTAPGLPEKFTEDSLRFYETYETNKDKEFRFHTRSLRPKDVLINLYNVKINKRKCFFKSTYPLDYSRKYTISLYYKAEEDISHLLNRHALGREDVIFMGELHSNEVELCFK